MNFTWVWFGSVEVRERVLWSHDAGCRDKVLRLWRVLISIFKGELVWLISEEYSESEISRTCIYWNYSQLKFWAKNQLQIKLLERTNIILVCKSASLRNLKHLKTIYFSHFVKNLFNMLRKMFSYRIKNVFSDFYIFSLATS